YSSWFDGAANVVIVADKDEPGLAHAQATYNSLRKTLPDATIAIVEAATGKDAADHLYAGRTLDELVPIALPDDPDTRTNLRDPAAAATTKIHAASRTPPGPPPALALEANILACFFRDLRRAGVAGEERLAQIDYLALTSRALPWGRPGERPVSV